MKEIKLSQGKVALVDDEDFDYLNQYTWYVNKRVHTYYATRFDNKIKKTIIMHREIMNTPAELQVDHIDHNGLNNQKYNLRNCTGSENLKNKTSARGHSSIYLGVQLHRGYRKYINKRGKLRIYYTKLMYVAHATIDGKNKHIGRFYNEKDAAIAYNEFALKYYGAFANVNKFL